MKILEYCMALYGSVIHFWPDYLTIVYRMDESRQD